MIKDFDYNDLFNAYLKAKKSRKNKQEIYLFDQNKEERLKNIFNELKSKNYKHGIYKKIILNDSKKRYIYSPTFRDHIVHHLLYAKIYNLIDDKLLDSTFACRKNFGSHKALYYLKDIIKSNKYLDKIVDLNKDNFEENDLSKISCSINSRFGVFTHSSFGLKYFKKRGDIDFHSWG